MSPIIHDFDERLAYGRRHERALDGFFQQWYEIRAARDNEQRQGIDRHFARGGRALTVEYKTDHQADSTGNIFVETVSRDDINSPGGHISSQADRLVIYLPDSELIYWLSTAKLRTLVHAWRDVYREAAAPNRTYNTLGLLVPQHEFERHSRVINLADYDHWRAVKRKIYG